MTRWLLNLITALSLLLFAAIAALWARSYLPPDFYLFSRQGRVIAVFTESYMSQHFGPREGRSRDVARPMSDARAGARVHWTGPGLEFIKGPVGRFVVGPPGRPRLISEGRYVILSVSYAYLAVPAAAAALVAALFSLRHRAARRRAGHCGSCGYDLTGNVSGVCPECGERRGHGAG